MNKTDKLNIDHSAMDACKKHWDSIAKPIAGLGLFEDIIIKIAGIQGSDYVDISKKAVVIMCSDNGVVKEKVTQTDSSVTAVVTENFAKGIASINQMAMAAGAFVIPVDIGVARDLKLGGLLNKKISYGTGNIAKKPAMTGEQAIKGIDTGIEIMKELKIKGYQIIGTGEMGIGNTTTSSAVASVLLNMPVEEVTGKGAGLSTEGLGRKIQVIKEAIRINRPDPADPVEVLAKLGGYDIAGMTGLYLGGMQYGIPIVIDGVISAVAALIAARINREAVNYMIPSHMSKEPASIRIMEELGLTPIIHGNLALGEGTGTALLFPMLDMVLKVYHFNSTFDDIKVQAYESFETNQIVRGQGVK
ncbi:MAG: nicotinate-nucleotide--dimethylbenzimidazole phosphoribosyltransferase [Anaerocolumna sp.]